MIDIPVGCEWKFKLNNFAALHDAILGETMADPELQFNASSSYLPRKIKRQMLVAIHA